MDWIKPFFTTATAWWGRPEIRDNDHERADAIERLAGFGCKRILELGAGGGTTAAVTADRGHSVVAVELSPPRAEFIRERAAERPERDLTVVEGDFYELDLGGGFDCVCYWNGFGIGSDTDQRRLLRRMSSEWISPGGCVLMDVFSPWHWARIAGQRIQTHDAIELVNTNDYDPAASRFIDTWWPVDKTEAESVSQSARCYTPADLILLLEGTGLSLAHAEVDGRPLDLDPSHRSRNLLWEAWEYRVQLVPA